MENFEPQSADAALAFLNKSRNGDIKRASKGGLYLRSSARRADDAATREEKGGYSLGVRDVIDRFALVTQPWTVKSPFGVDIHPDTESSCNLSRGIGVSCDGIHDMMIAPSRLICKVGLIPVAAEYAIGHVDFKMRVPVTAGATVYESVMPVGAVDMIAYDPKTHGFVIVELKTATQHSVENYMKWSSDPGGFFQSHFLCEQTIKQMQMYAELLQITCVCVSAQLPKVSYGLLIGASQTLGQARAWRIDWKPAVILGKTPAFLDMWNAFPFITYDANGTPACNFTNVAENTRKQEDDADLDQSVKNIQDLLSVMNCQ